MIRISRPCAIMQNHWYTRQVCFPGKPHVLRLTHIIRLPCQGYFVLLVLLGGVLRNLSVTCPSLPAWGPCECTMWMQSLMHRQCHCSVASGMVTSTCSSLLKAYHVGDKTQGWLTCRNSFGNGRSLLSRSTHSALIVTPCLPMISGKLEGCIITPSSLKSSAKGRSDRIAHIQRGAKFGCSCNTNRTFRNENRPSSQVVCWERTGFRNQGKTEETWNCKMDQWYRIIPKDDKWCLMFPLIKQCIKQLRIHGMDGMETSSQLVLESHSTVTLLYQLLCHRHDYHKIPWNTLEYHEKCKRACANMNLILIATANVAKRVYVVNLVNICVICFMQKYAGKVSGWHEPGCKTHKAQTIIGSSNVSHVSRVSLIAMWAISTACVRVLWKLYTWKTSRRELFFWYETSWNGFAIWKSGKCATCGLYHHLTHASWGPTIVKISPLVSMFFTPVFSSDGTKQNRTKWESNIWNCASVWTSVSVYSLKKSLCTVFTLCVCVHVFFNQHISVNTELLANVMLRV